MGLIFIISMLIFMAAMYLNLLKGAKKADIKLNKLSEEERKIVEKLKIADTYRDLSIDEYYTIKNLFSLDEMEEE